MVMLIHGPGGPDVGGGAYIRHAPTVLIKSQNVLSGTKNSLSKEYKFAQSFPK